MQKNKYLFVPDRLFFLLMFFIFSSLSYATNFNIGYIEGESELGSNWFQQLETDINSNERIREALGESGINSIAFIPAEGFVNCIQRMNIGEFDAVFCNSVVFCEQKSDYKPILQTRTPNDQWRSLGGQPVLQHGVVIVRGDSEIAKKDDPSNKEIGDFISSRGMGFVSQYSAAGYIIPALRIRKEYGVVPKDMIFCKSSQDVVKYVVSGILEIGACEQGVVDEVFKDQDLKDDIKEMAVKILFKTDPYPTDPFVVKEKYLPVKSKLGRELKDYLRKYYNKKTNGKVRLEMSSDEYYDDLREQLSAFSVAK